MLAEVEQGAQPAHLQEALGPRGGRTAHPARADVRREGMDENFVMPRKPQRCAVQVPLQADNEGGAGETDLLGTRKGKFDILDSDRDFSEPDAFTTETDTANSSDVQPVAAIAYFEEENYVAWSGIPQIESAEIDTVHIIISNCPALIAFTTVPRCLR